MLRSISPGTTGTTYGQVPIALQALGAGIDFGPFSIEKQRQAAVIIIAFLLEECAKHMVTLQNLQDLQKKALLQAKEIEKSPAYQAAQEKVSKKLSLNPEESFIMTHLKKLREEEASLETEIKNTIGLLQHKQTNIQQLQGQVNQTVQGLQQLQNSVIPTVANAVTNGLETYLVEQDEKPQQAKEKATRAGKQFSDAVSQSPTVAEVHARYALSVQQYNKDKSPNQRLEVKDNLSKEDVTANIKNLKILLVGILLPIFGNNIRKTTGFVNKELDNILKDHAQLLRDYTLKHKDNLAKLKGYFTEIQEARSDIAKLSTKLNDLGGKLTTLRGGINQVMAVSGAVQAGKIYSNFVIPPQGAPTFTK